MAEYKYDNVLVTVIPAKRSRRSKANATEPNPIYVVDKNSTTKLNNQNQQSDAQLCASEPSTSKSRPLRSSTRTATATTTAAPDPNNGNSGSDSPQLSSRRFFTNDFKLNVLDAFNNDPNCIGNQRATARKFGIHRRQVQKWLQPAKQSNSKEGSLNELIQTPSSINGSKSSDASGKELTSSTESENSANPATPPPDDLSKLSASDMALSLNLSMNPVHTSSQHFNPLAMLQLQAPRIISPTPSPIPSHLYSNNYTNNNNNYTTSNNNNKNYNSSSTNNYNTGNNYNCNNNINVNKIPVRNISPGNRSTSSKGSQRRSKTVNNNLDIVDEIAYLYPHEDYNLLRRGIARNEISFSKIKNTTPPSSRVRGQSNRRASPPQRSPKINGIGNGDGINYSTQQALELFRHQSDYLRLLQQSGMNLPLNMDLHALQGHFNLTQKNQWLGQNGHQLPSPTYVAPAAPTNGNGNDTANRKRPASNHTFISPKVPSNSKPKTVAAALAASRLSPTLKLGMDEPSSKSRNSHPRKRQPRQAKPSPPVEYQEEEFIDPTTMLEVTSSTTEENVVDLSSNNCHSETEYYNGNHISSPTENGGFAQSQKSPDQQQLRLAKIDSELTKVMALQAYISDPEVAGDPRALARKFSLNVRVVMKWIKESSFKNLSLPPNGTNGYKNGITDYTAASKLCATMNGNGNGGLDLTMMKLLNSMEQ